MSYINIKNGYEVGNGSGFGIENNNYVNFGHTHIDPFYGKEIGKYED
jgi:hypothetical protein